MKGNRRNRKELPRRLGSKLLLEQLETRMAPSVNVTTYHYDQASTGANLQETILNPSNVNSSTFGKLFTVPVDGQVYAQPLYMSDLNFPSGPEPGVHNVVYIATEYDSVYAYDADNGVLLWHDSFIDPAQGLTPVPQADTLSFNIAPWVGITSTPVIDPSTNTIWVCANTKDVESGQDHYLFYMHALDLITGAEKFGGPMLMADTIFDGSNFTYVAGVNMNGNGDGSVNGITYLNGLRELQRAALTLADGSVYVAFASHSDNGPYHGWIIGYNADTGALSAVFNDTPNGGEGGIWMSGAKMVVDSQGYIYAMTGNGDFDSTLNSAGFPSEGDYGMSFIKLAVDTSSSQANQNINGWGLKVVDYFTPFNYQTLNNSDLDLGSGGPMLLPASVGSSAHPDLLIGAGKSSELYVLDANEMGEYHANTDDVVQEMNSSFPRVYTPPSYFDGTIYYVGSFTPDYAKTFSVSDAVISGPIQFSADTFAYPGSSPTISADGTANGIFWVIEAGTDELRAYNALNLSDELYTSAQAPNGRDALGTAVKFTEPTVVNGKVYVGTTNSLVVYGLLTSPTSAPAAPTTLIASTFSSVEIDLAWTDNSIYPNNASEFLIERSIDGVHFTQVGIASVGVTSYQDTNLTGNTQYYYEVSAVNSAGVSAYTNIATATTLPVTTEQPPNAPSNLDPIVASGNEIDLYWTNNSDNTTSFKIDRSTDGLTFTQVAVTDPGATRYNDTGLNDNTTYYYKICATNDAGDSSFTSIASATTADVPLPPDNLTATKITTNEIDLIWEDNANNADGYYVYQQVLPEGEFSLVAILSPTATAFDVTHLSPGVNYEYHVNAHNVAGFSEFTGAQFWTVPAAPTGVAAQGGRSQVFLSWTPVTGAASYNVYRGTTSGGEGPTPFLTGITGTAATDIGLTNGKTYYYKVTAVDPGGESVASNQVNAIPRSTDPVVATRFILTGFPSSLVAGTVESVDVTAEDADGNVATTYTGTIQFTSSDPLAGLPATYTFTSANNGKHTFNVTLKTSGTQSFTVTDEHNANITGQQANILVSAAAPHRFVLSGLNKVVNAGTTRSFTITVEDVYDNIVPNYTQTVYFTDTDPSASLPSSYVFTTADGGVHVFKNALTVYESGSQTFTASDPVDTLSLSFTYTVEPLATSKFALSGYPTATIAGSSGLFTVQAEDTFGNVTPGYTGTVELSSTDKKTLLPGDYIFTSADEGVHVFSATFETVGSQALFVNDTFATGIRGFQQNIKVSPAATAMLLVSGLPTSISAGNSQSITVTAEDAFGNLTPAYNGTIIFTSTDGLASLPGQYTFKTADDGAHTFTPGVTFETTGAQSVSASDASNSSITGSAGTTVESSETFLFSGLPANATAGSTFTVTVTATTSLGGIDATYSGTVQFASSDAAALLPSNYTFVASDDGVHTFSITLKTAGTQSVTVSDTTDTNRLPAHFAESVAPGDTTQLVFSGLPSTVTAGNANGFVLIAEDSYGNITPGYTSSVSFTSSDVIAALPAKYTFTAADGGAHAFKITLKTAGVQSVTVTDNSNPVLTNTVNNITVVPGPTAKLSIKGIPQTTTAGTVITFTVTARDSSNNITPGYTGTVVFSNTDPKALYPASYVFTAADQGVHIFGSALTVITAGAQGLSVADSVQSSVGSTLKYTVQPKAASTLVLSGFSSSTTAGVAEALTVTAEDPYGNIASSYLGAIAFSSSDPRASLPLAYTFTASDQGVHSFVATLITAGSQSISVTGNLGSVHAAITVNAAAAHALIITGFPNSVTAGVANTLTVTLYDTYSNLATGYTGTVLLSSSDAQASLPSSYTFTSSDAGTHAFSVTLITPGSQSLNVVDSANSTLSASQTNILVSPASASRIVFSGSPSSTVAGTSLPITVTLYDPNGNVATNYTGTIQFSSSDPQASLPSQYVFTAADAGTHTFAAALKTAGLQSITATDALNASLQGTDSNITVTPAATSTFVVSGFPATLTAGTTQPFQVIAEDPYGNRTPGYTGTVRFSSTDTKAGLPANFVFTSANAGEATFSAQLKTAGSQTISVSDINHSAVYGSVSGILVTAGAAAKIGIGAFPTSIKAGVAHAFTVTIRDQFNNIVTNFTGTVQITSSDPLAVLPANYVFTAADQGTHNYSPGATFETVGPQDLSATVIGMPALTVTFDVTVKAS
jgi:fibronectin type 3 domain-containing protein